MRKGDNDNHHHVNQPNDYGDPIPPPSDTNAPPDDINGNNHGHTTSHEALQDTHTAMNEDGHAEHFLEDENGSVGWNFLDDESESIHGEQGTEHEPFGLSRGVYIPAHGWYRPHHPYDCPCPCHHAPAQAELPDDWIPDPATPSPEGQDTLSSMQVELSTGDHSMVSSGYVSRTISVGELVRLIGAHVPSLFVTRPLVLNGHAIMPPPPMPFHYPMDVSWSDDHDHDED